MRTAGREVDRSAGRCCATLDGRAIQLAAEIAEGIHGAVDAVQDASSDVSGGLKKAIATTLLKGRLMTVDRLRMPGSLVAMLASVVSSLSTVG